MMEQFYETIHQTDTVAITVQKFRNLYENYLVSVI